VMGWTLNHDKVMGSGKEAFAARQDRYADAMEPLGLKCGFRFIRPGIPIPIRPPIPIRFRPPVPM
ncbi:MAG: hypothetical protein WCQ50_16655, partial [Spirochaetota bacterium]